MIEATEERKEQLKADMQRLLKEWQERLFLEEMAKSLIMAKHGWTLEDFRNKGVER